MITSTDINLYRSFENSLSSTNGGPLSTFALTSNTYGNIFKNVTDRERMTGSVTYAKVFWKIDNIDNTALTNAFIYMPKYTVGGDYITFFPGTFVDTQMNITGTERYYGASPLSANVSAGTSQLITTPEHFSIINIIQTADDIVITNGVLWERHNNVTVSIVNSELHITLDTDDAFQNSFVSGETTVASICKIPDIAGSATSPAVISSNGAYNSSFYHIEPRHKGGLSQTWTLTFSNSSQYTCRGNTVGYVGIGTIYTDFAPINTALNAPYFMLRKAGFNNGWSEGDTITFITNPSAQAIWLKRVVPAGTISVSNLFETALSGESA